VVDGGDRDKWWSDLCAQRRRLHEAFCHGWVSPARGPVVFSEEQLARIEEVRDHGGLLNAQEHEATGSCGQTGGERSTVACIGEVRAFATLDFDPGGGRTLLR
jgi:hypothetical protein